MNAWLHDVSLLFEQLVNVSYPFCRWDLSFLMRKQGVKENGDSSSLGNVFVHLFLGFVFTSIDRMFEN